MYQRYYKQRKFGKIFGVGMVIISGISHYAKNALQAFKKVSDLKNIEKYDEFLPLQIKHTIDVIQNKAQNFKQRNETKDEINYKLKLLESNIELLKSNEFNQIDNFHYKNKFYYDLYKAKNLPQKLEVELIKKLYEKIF